MKYKALECLLRARKLQQEMTAAANVGAYAVPFGGVLRPAMVGGKDSALDPFTLPDTQSRAWMILVDPLARRRG